MSEKLEVTRASDYDSHSINPISTHRDNKFLAATAPVLDPNLTLPNPSTKEVSTSVYRYIALHCRWKHLHSDVHSGRIHQVPWRRVLKPSIMNLARRRTVMMTVALNLVRRTLRKTPLVILAIMIKSLRRALIPIIRTLSLTSSPVSSVTCNS